MAQRRELSSSQSYLRRQSELFVVGSVGGNAPAVRLILADQPVDAESCAGVASPARRRSDNILAPQGITKKAF